MIRELENTTLMMELDSQEQVADSMPMNWITVEEVKSSAVMLPLSVAESKTTVKNVALSENLAEDREGAGSVESELSTLTVMLFESYCAALVPDGVSTTVYVPVTRAEPMSKKLPPGFAAELATVVLAGATVSLSSPVVEAMLPVESYTAALMVTLELGLEESE
jgi:hypothetical protein